MRRVNRTLGMEKAPCEDCTQRSKCKDEEIACRVYAGFVVRGFFSEDAVRLPSKSIFKQLYGNKSNSNLDNCVREYMKELRVGLHRKISFK